MKKRTIFLVMLVLLLSLFVVSLTKVNAAEPTYSGGSGAVLNQTVLEEGYVCGTTTHAGRLTIDFGDGVVITADNQYLNFKAYFKDIYRVNLYVYDSDGGTQTVKWFAGASDQTDSRIVTKIDEEGIFLYRGDLSDGIESPAVLLGKTITKFELEFYTSSSGEFQLLGCAFDADKTYDSWRELYVPAEVVLPTEFEIKSGSSAITIENNVATVSTTEMKYGGIYTEFDAITSLSSLYYSIKYKATGITTLQAVVYDSTGAYSYCGNILPEKSSNVTVTEYDEFTVVTTYLSEKIASLADLVKITFNVQAEVEGASIEILDFSITTNDKHGFEVPMVIGDLEPAGSAVVEKNDEGENVISYSESPSAGYNYFVIPVANHKEKLTALEFVFTPQNDTELFFKIGSSEDWSIGYKVYEGGTSHTVTFDLTKFSVAGKSFDFQFMLDCNVTVETANTVTINSFRFYNPLLTDLEYTVSDLETVYTGSPVEFKATCEADVELVYEYAVAGSTEWTSGLPVNAGEYVVRVSYVGEEYNEASKEANVVIKKAPSTVNASDVTYDAHTRVVTVKEGVAAYDDEELMEGCEVYNEDVLAYGTVVYYYVPGDDNHEASEVLSLTIAKHTVSEEWSKDETHHWNECECGLDMDKAEHVAGDEWKSDETNHWHECECGAKLDEAAHVYNVDAYGNGYTWKACECGKKGPDAEVAYLTAIHTYANGLWDGDVALTNDDLVVSTLGEDGTYSFEFTTPKWGRVVLYYNGVAISSTDVTMVNGTAWDGGSYSGGYPLYQDGDTITFLSATGGDYKVSYNPTENTLLLGDYIEPLPEGAYSVIVNGDSALSVWTETGKAIKDVTDTSTGASTWIGNGWRLYVVVDSTGRICYLVANPPNGYGGPSGTSYARHSYYNDYKSNPAFTILDGFGPWVSGGYVHNLYEVVVPEGGFVITAHSDSKTTLIEALLGLASDAQGDAAVNTNAHNVDKLIVVYNAEKNYIQVTSHEHAAEAEWGKDATHHWHECETCALPLEKAEHAWNEGEVTTAPTCTVAGVKTYTCTVCSATKTEEVAATGHTEVEDAAVAATCTEKGKTAGSHCSVCSEVLVAQEEVAATGHTEVVDAAVAATCTEKGKTEGKHCSVCNEVLVAQEEVPALGHAYDDEYDADCNTCSATREVPKKETVGCGGSVIASIFGVLALAGAVVVLRKKREE